MIKKQQKWIALLLTVTFAWLLQVSSMPLAAAGASEQVGSANVEPGPGFLETVSLSAAPAPKKSILPMVLIGVGLVAVTAAVLFLVVPKKYDITGTWTMNYKPGAQPLVTYSITFTGNKKTGTAAMHTVVGDYTVDDKAVTITMYQGNNVNRWEFIGEFTSKIHLEGDFKYYTNDVLQSQYNGTFYADKQ
jgi:hypothetical protein